MHQQQSFCQLDVAPVLHLSRLSQVTLPSVLSQMSTLFHITHMSLVFYSLKANLLH